MKSEKAEFQTLNDLLIDELRDLYDAERQLVKAIPKMAKAAESDELRSALEEHLMVTQNQVERLDQIFESLGEKPTGKKCAAMHGLIEEGQEAVSAKGDRNVRDAAIIGAAQKVEHYEMAAYGTARTHAETLGQTETASLLQQTLDEEGEADKKLTELAETLINQQAAESAGGSAGSSRRGGSK
jgi:ferritin-like metal-binding protein YciE